MSDTHYIRHPFYVDVIIYPYEEWRDIEGYVGKYQVSNQGRVKSLARKTWNGSVWYPKPERILKPGKVNERGHLTVQLCKDGITKMRLIYHLVLEAFVCKRPNSLYALHYDDDRNNNNLENLRWGTARENMADAIRNGVLSTGEEHYNAKSTHDEVQLVRKLYKTGRYTQKELAARFKRSYVWIHKIVRYKQWRRM